VRVAWAGGRSVPAVQRDASNLRDMAALGLAASWAVFLEPPQGSMASDNAGVHLLFINNIFLF
jgi:hypothetical protein